jgi:hypothetical protein
MGKTLTVILLLIAANVLTCANDDESSVVFSFYGSTEHLGKDNITITISDGRQTGKLTGADIKQWPGESYERSAYVPTRSSGSLFVNFVLVSSEGDTTSSGNVKLNLKADWRWGVDFHLAPENPRRYCFGCFGSESYPLTEPFRENGIDSVFVVWGGNSISHPVVY